MPQQHEVWQQFEQDMKVVMAEVMTGLQWSRVEAPKPEDTALSARGSKFMVMVIHWKDDQGRTGFNGVVTIISPHICIINLPPSAAKQIWDRAASSLN